METQNRRKKSTPEMAIMRFWEKVDKKEEGQCWNWKGYKGRTGHGQMTIMQKQVYVHRFSWELHNGREIPDGMYVCHKCDNGSCVNPNHLFIGTQKENVDDMVSKGRAIHPLEGRVRGEKNGNSKLNLEQVNEIRKKYIPYKVTHKQLGLEFGVSEITIRKILKGQLWNYEKSNI